MKMMIPGATVYSDGARVDNRVGEARMGGEEEGEREGGGGGESLCCGGCLSLLTRVNPAHS